MLPFVSVIVPTYRREALLRSTLEQLLGQDYSPYELLVVDQSSNHEQQTADFLQANAARIRYFKLSQPNLPAARNYGIAKSQGSIVVFSDDDMILPPDCITKLVDTYTRDDVWGATGFTLGHADIDEKNYLEYQQRVDRGRAAVGATMRVNHFNGCLMSFRREIFGRIGYFDEWMGTQPMAAGEDSEFCYRAMRAKLGLWLNPSLVTRHLAGKVGGCGRRELEVAHVVEQQMRMHFYVVLKNRRMPGKFGWALGSLRCYRDAVINRELLSGGFSGLRKRHAHACAVIAQTREVVEKLSGSCWKPTPEQPPQTVEGG